MVGGGGEAVWREECRGGEQDGARVETGRDQTVLMDRVLEERIHRGVSWMRRATCGRLSRRGVG